MKGYASLPAGTEGQCDNTFSFTGASGEVNYGIDLKGAREGAFSLSANPNVVSWSPCGGSTAILNMNTQCSISPTEDRALIAVGEYNSGPVWKHGVLTKWIGRSHQQQAHRSCCHSVEKVLISRDAKSFGVHNCLGYFRVKGKVRKLLVKPCSFRGFTIQTITFRGR